MAQSRKKAQQNRIESTTLRGKRGKKEKNESFVYTLEIRLI